MTAPRSAAGTWPTNVWLSCHTGATFEVAPATSQRGHAKNQTRTLKKDVRMGGSEATAPPRARGTPEQIAQNGRDARREGANAEA